MAILFSLEELVVVAADTDDEYLAVEDDTAALFLCGRNLMCL
jgi:hypothetical protein